MSIEVPRPINRHGDDGIMDMIESMVLVEGDIHPEDLAEARQALRTAEHLHYRKEWFTNCVIPGKIHKCVIIVTGEKRTGFQKCGRCGAALLQFFPLEVAY